MNLALIERALKTLRYPQIWLCLFLPLIVSVIFVLSTVIFFWFDLFQLVTSITSQPMQSVVMWFNSWLPHSLFQMILQLKEPIVLMLFILFVIAAALPLVIALTTAISSLVSSTYLVHFLARNDFSILQPQGRSVLIGSMWNGLVYSVLYILIWVICIPIFIFLPFGFVLSVILTAWYYRQVSSYDILSYWCTDDEIRKIKDQTQTTSLIVSFVGSLSLIMPLAFVFTPVIVNILLIQFYGQKLQSLRYPESVGSDTL